MRFARAVFLIAGMAVVAPLYFMEARIGREMPPAITHPEYFYGFAGVTLAWQLLFLVLASDPLRYRSMMLPANRHKSGIIGNWPWGRSHIPESRAGSTGRCNTI